MSELIFHYISQSSPEKQTNRMEVQICIYIYGHLSVHLLGLAYMILEAKSRICRAGWQAGNSSRI